MVVIGSNNNTFEGCIRMSEKEVTDKQIDDKLDELIKFDGDMVDLRKTVRFYAKIIYNLRFDLNELKLELLKVLKDECEEVNHKKEEEDGRFYS